MNEYFDLLKMIDVQWDEINAKMALDNFDYKDINCVRKVDFFDRLFQILENDNSLLLVNQSDIKHIFRAAECVWKDTSRFIPKWDYASINRMNGKDKLYYYFGISYKKYNDEAIKTCFHEIRLENRLATVCEFKLRNNLKIIDFTKDDNPPQTEVDVQNYLSKYINTVGDEYKGIKLALSKLYFSLFSDSGAFTPIDKKTNSEDKIKVMYMPFWTLTEYLESKKFDGIIFNSSVHSSGKNLVIFDLKNAYPVESSLKILEKKDYI